MMLTMEPRRVRGWRASVLSSPGRSPPPPTCSPTARPRSSSTAPVGGRIQAGNHGSARVVGAHVGHQHRVGRRYLPRSSR